MPKPTNVREALIRHYRRGKSQTWLLLYGSDAEGIVEDEINGMTNLELIELMEDAGIIQLTIKGE